ncbi:MAG TPA: hypothetical protein VGJ75_09660 [Dongiaceae bacterium]|jgi:hypothetical protein
MWEFRHKVRTLVSGMLAHRRHPQRVSPGRAADWLPPVLGPDDWSIGMMSDRSAGWYFDRHS